MANRLLKGLAVAAGTGLAMGFTSGRARVGSVRYRTGDLNSHAGAVSAPATSPDHAALDHTTRDGDDEEFLDIEPLLDRVERLEARVDQIAGQHAGPAPAPVSDRPLAAYAESIADLERRVEQNTRELELLRKSITEAEARMTESVTSVERKLEQTREELPAIIEPQIDARLAELQTRFTAEIERSHRRTLEVFEHALDEKISSRIGAIEKALSEQAGSIEALSTRAAETDNNLQRLVTAIEKLCERAQLIPSGGDQRIEQPVAPAPLPRQTHVEGRSAFESRFTEAMKGNPVVPVLRTEEPETPQVPPPAFAAPKKSRFLFRNLIVAGFGFLASRFLR